MSDFNFDLKPAKKEAIPPLIGLWGPQGCGKTLSALKLARGIVGPAGKIVFGDTENKRALFYADECGPWDHCDLQPPFTPEKFGAFFTWAEQQGADAIVLDSGSHVWSGEGGVLDKADASASSGLAKWKAPKMAYKRMMNNLTRAPIPVIICYRGQEAVKQVGKDIVPVGWKPVCEKNTPFEMTIFLRMTSDGHYDLEQSKPVPGPLRPVITADGIVTEEMGRKIAEWCGSGLSVDQEYLKLKRDGADAAIQGVQQYTVWKDALTGLQKDKIKQHHAEWVKTAKQADADKQSAEEPPAM